MKRVREALQSNLQTKVSVQQHIAALRAVPANYSESSDIQTADFAALIESSLAASADDYRYSTLTVSALYGINIDYAPVCRCLTLGMHCSAEVQGELTAFDIRMRALDASQRADEDDEDLVMENDGTDLAQNLACPMTMIPVRACCLLQSPEDPSRSCRLLRFPSLTAVSSSPRAWRSDCSYTQTAATATASRVRLQLQHSRRRWAARNSSLSLTAVWRQSTGSLGADHGAGGPS